jgi:hypothetical protein
MVPWSALLVTTAASGVLLGLGHYRQRDKQLSSDGDRYLTMGRGAAVPYPFMLRWLIPAICRTSQRAWWVSTNLHLLALPVLTTIYIGHWPVRTSAAVVGGMLICGFAGIWRNNIRRPVLVDPPALAWTLLSAILVLNGAWPAGVAVALVAACMKETAPVFAACFSLNPLPLIGLVAPLVRRLLARAGEDTHHSQALADPLGAARQAHADHLFDPVVMLAPWGAGLLAIAVQDTRVALIAILALLLGYAQLVTAVNTVRLYQWAGPAVALAAATALPAGWEPAVLLVHLFNPWAGNGR